MSKILEIYENTTQPKAFLIGPNSLACLNDFLQNNDRMVYNEPRKGLADQAVLVNGHNLGMPGQSHNRVNGRSELHVSSNGTEVL